MSTPNTVAAASPYIHEYVFAVYNCFQHNLMTLKLLLTHATLWGRTERCYARTASPYQIHASTYHAFRFLLIQRTSAFSCPYCRPMN